VLLCDDALAGFPIDGDLRGNAAREGEVSKSDALFGADDLQFGGVDLF